MDEWYPSMRGGVVVGAHGEGSPNRMIPERGRVRWYLVGTSRPAELVIVTCLLSMVGALFRV